MKVSVPRPISRRPLAFQVICGGRPAFRPPVRPIAKPNPPRDGGPPRAA